MKLTRKQLDYLFFGLIILVLLFMVFTVAYMVSNKEAFTSNPFIYGASKLGGDVHCSCLQIDGERRAVFKFNTTYWWSEPTEQFAFQTQ